MEFELTATQSMRCPKPDVRFLLTRTTTIPTRASPYSLPLRPEPRPEPRPGASFLSLSASQAAVYVPADRSLSGELPFDDKELLKRYSGILRECAARGRLCEGELVHGGLIKRGVVPDSHLWVSLINFYAKCGRPGLARKVLDEIPERDVVSWTALISGFISEGCGREGVGLYCEMREDDVRPNEYSLTTVLKGCSMCLDVEFGKQVHAEAIKSGVSIDLFVGSALVDVYAKCGELELASRVFAAMPEKNIVSWTVLLNGYAQSGDGKEVLKLCYMMMESQMKLNPYTLCTALRACAGSGMLREGKALHSMAIRTGCELDEFLSSSLIDMYCKCGTIGDALNVFNRTRDPDVVACTTMIAGLDQEGRAWEAAELFIRMMRIGVRPNEFTLSSVVSVASSVGDLRYGESIHACVWKWGFESDIAIGNSLIMMYTRNGNVHDGYRAFESMTDRNIVSWNAFISGLNDLETCREGPRVFYQMLQEGFKPNMYTLVAVLRSCSSSLNVGYGKQVHAHVVKNSSGADDFVGTALVDMYARNGCLEDAYSAFSQLSTKGVFAWTVIIACYAQTNQGEKAVQHLKQMQEQGVKPNEFTLASCLSACASMTTLETGRQLQSVAIKTGHHDDVVVATALADMYEKCGCMEDAEAVFEGLASRDTVFWNTIISGYSRHGQGKKALESFNVMLDEGVVPDGATFVGVLTACSHMGMVEEGKSFFDSITQEHGLVPSLEHYACMVDILSRAGRFDEVETFVEKMKLREYSMIWETILGACKLHGNVELGVKAAKKLVEIEPNMDSSYIQLSNIYAAEGRWDDVKSVRVLMTNQGVKKEPGCSWVEVDGQVHMFVSQDGAHPKTKEIYAKLQELGERLELAGHVPKTENVLHNITERERVEHLVYHSERLALGFALIGTSPSKTIRIFKNSRICEESHSVMKLLSDLTNREIVVRDVKRFHHFRRGTCSCQDYW